MKCKKCGELMDTKEKEFISIEYDGVKVIYECEECGLTCEAHYIFEHLEPDPVFWSDE